ncbi:hypothetical protein [Paenibacillus thalictri]|uniref:DUF3604 domain-containing protein n=1 Tax=Paenibacillus thalictri TaxID=2527873 RepID=A0A4Q9DQV8_9BACL|nr:hypothetical protein [Paenibacillus thalictri]TBL79017.1 hypothetical protein EYB31_12390 [Paenibacillus thalictri]
MNIYWGDLHNHCGISYGYGSLENALKAAKGQLDFVTVIGHASWHDMPERTPELEFLVDFHVKGFAKLKAQWEQVLETVKQANVPHEFVAFQGYEAHSSLYGDHHIVCMDDDMPLLQDDSPYGVVAKLKPRRAIAVPHHVGYTPGYRGGNWDTFDPAISPIVEVYSKHGCGMSDESLYPYLHDMGPRDSRSMVFAGIQKGHRFGFVGSTDHHAGYPGSYGDGRLAVLATEKTREGIWEAIQARRTYAVTGDKMQCGFRLNGADMGSEVQVSGERNLQLDIKGCDRFDKIVVYKNLRPWKTVAGESLRVAAGSAAGTYKVRVEMGWGDAKDGYFWQGQTSVQGGKLASVETCFRGRSVLAPTPDMKDNPNMNELHNELVSQTENEVTWTCTTFKNPTTLHSHTAALILEIEGDVSTVVEVTLNGKTMSASIGELLLGSRSVHLKPHNSEAFVLHRAVPEAEYTFSGEWIDTEKEAETDVYHVEIRQVNNQYAWISPIFVV